MIKNLKYIKDINGDIKSAVIRTDEKVEFSKLEELSKKLKYTLYLVPKYVDIEFNDNAWIIYASGIQAKNIWQFVNGWAMPYECFVNGFPFPVKMEEMWDCDKKEEEIPIEELKWNLEYPWWDTNEDIPYNLTPQEVLNDFNKYPKHRKWIKEVDTNYPLVLIKTKQGRWLIYDGVHRFIKEILDGKASVLAKKFCIMDMDRYIHQCDRARFEQWKGLKYKEQVK